MSLIFGLDPASSARASASASELGGSSWQCCSLANPFIIVDVVVVNVRVVVVTRGDAKTLLCH